MTKQHYFGIIVKRMRETEGHLKGLQNKVKKALDFQMKLWYNYKAVEEKRQIGHEKERKEVLDKRE